MDTDKYLAQAVEAFYFEETEEEHNNRIDDEENRAYDEWRENQDYDMQAETDEAMLWEL